MTQHDPGAQSESANDRGASPSSPHIPPAGGGWRRPLIAALLLVAAATVGFWGRPAARSQRWLRRAEAARQQGDLAAAEAAAVRAFELDNANAAAGLLAAEAAADQRELDRAASRVERITRGDAAVRLRAAIFRARLNHFRRGRLREAEDAYRDALKIDPDSLEALSGLVELLGLCNRRREAIPLVLRQLQLGRATEQLLLLARESAVVQNAELLALASQATPHDAAVSLGLAWQAAENGDDGAALALVREAVNQRPGFEPALIALGRQLLAAERFDELQHWVQRQAVQGLQSPEAWYVRGRLAEHLLLYEGALKCYSLAAGQAPESKPIVLAVIRLLEHLDQLPQAPDFVPHLQRMQALEDVQNRLLFAGTLPRGAAWLELSAAYAAVGRRWEAYGWLLLAVEQHGEQDPAVLQALEDARQSVKGLPLELVDPQTSPMKSAEYLNHLRMPRYPPPPLLREQTRATIPAPPRGIAFRDDAAAAGLQFVYRNGTPGHTRRRMYEFTGGGLAVLDFDVDGWPDLVCTQGGPGPPGDPAAAPSDELYRNLGAGRFLAAGGLARLVESGFGQGAAVGDVDSDGFPDLYVANIGVNQLWRNCGDGSFQPLPTPPGTAPAWTTSCLLVDLTGDGHPDLFDVNYLQGPDVLERVCRHASGLEVMCMPFDFDPAPDRCFVNDGSGGFTEATAGLFDPPPEGRGLGVLAWSPQADGRLAVFIANDTSASFLYRPRDGGAGPRWVEQGVPAGVAFSGDGKATGCMGAATTDLDDDGRLDLVVTNFLAESNSLFLQRDAGLFEDRSRALGMHALSFDMLGFGTQFLDANLDGRPELFIANGHVDDLRRLGRPYAMRPQLLACAEFGCRELPGAELGPYFQETWLGRSAVRLDWNRDGREDLVVGALQTPTALLTNMSAASGRGIALQLIGDAAGRDAVGAVVRSQTDGSSRLHPLTAGDGYQASNERRLVVGAGSAAHVDDLEVRWPSGAVQTFSNVPTGRAYLLVEGGELLLAAAQAQRPAD